MSVMSSMGALIPLPLVQRDFRRTFRQDGPSPLDNMPLALRISGRLDHRALALAVEDVALRHEPLRTYFPDVDGIPRQMVLPDLPDQARLTRIGCRARDVADILAAEYARAFDLAAEVPLRARLLAVAEDEHVLLILLHHIACDGWSLRVLCNDLGAAYAARRRGAAPGWDPLPVRYRDYVYWQRDLLGDERDPRSLAHRQLAYWRAALAGVPEELALPFDRPRPAVASHRGGLVAADLDARLHARLAGLARDLDATLFMVVQAAVSVLLSRHGAGTDIPLPAAFAGRGESALEPMVGLFVNILILRADLSGNPSFRHLVERVRDVDLAAYEHADLPFTRIAENLWPAGPAGRLPLSRVRIAFETGGVERLAMDGLTVRSEPVALAGARRDLAFHFLDRYDHGGGPAGVDASVEYDADLFDERTARALADRLRGLLEIFAGDPGIRVEDVDLRSAQTEGGRAA
jgi:hypothetical protein